MSGLGNFLEVVYGPRQPFHSIQATLRQWRNRDLADKASHGRIATGRRKANMQANTRDSAIQEAELTIWLSLPDRIRIENIYKVTAHMKPCLIVVNDDRWWKRDHQGHVETTEVDQRQESKPRTLGLPGIEQHFSHQSLREYFVGLALEGSGFVETGGRNCIRLRAIPRPGGRLWPHWLPPGADEYELHVDPEYGVLLYVAARYRNEVFQVSEVMTVSFDEQLDDELFTYTPSAAEQVLPAQQVIRHLTLEAAIAQMPFTVLLPTRLPDAEHGGLEVIHHPPRLHSHREYLHLRYRGSQLLWLTESASPDPELQTMEWEQIDRHGQQMAISDPGRSSGSKLLAVHQLGTHVTICSNFDRERLIEVAASLVAASAWLRQ